MSFRNSATYYSRDPVTLTRKRAPSPRCPHGVDRAELATSTRFRPGASESVFLDPEESKQIADGEAPVG
jgi:hypothetical protein